MSTSVERRVVYYSGHVQGVGFRYSSQRIASRLPVTGFVRNLPDGRVELVAEGEPRDLEMLLAQIAEAMAGRITTWTVDRQPGTSEFSEFRIRH